MKTVSGDEVNYSWKDSLGDTSYSLSFGKTQELQADNSWVTKDKWSFNEQTFVSKNDVAGHVGDLREDHVARSLLGGVFREMSDQTDPRVVSCGSRIDLAG